MNKSEFISWLKSQVEQYRICWHRIYSNNDDYWYLYIPALDGLTPTLDLNEDGIVIYEYERSLDGDSLFKEFDYEDFIDQYKKNNL